MRCKLKLADIRCYCLLLLIPVNWASTFSIDPKDVDWTMKQNLDKNFHLSWFTKDPDWITMEFKTTQVGGWSSIGFSPKGGMGGADMVMAWFDQNGKPQIRDTYGVKNGQPLEDDSNDYELLHASQIDGTGMTFRIRRKWNTCDTKHDFKITNDTIFVIFASGDLGPDGTPTYHGPKQRGVKSLYLTVPTKVAPYPDDYETPDPTIEEVDMIMNNVSVPGGETTRYMCQMMKYPTHDRKHQIIGWRPIIQKENIDYIHHILVYECYVAEGDSTDIFEKDVGRIETCYTRDMPTHWGQYCLNVPFVWNHGAEGDMLPDHIGIPIGEKHGGATYLVFEMHYNIQDKSSFVDNSGIRLFLTDKIRPYDLTSLWIASRFSSFSPFIPPGVASHTMSAACTAECTETTFPPEGISAYSVIFHTHGTGRRVTLKHIRNGTELEPIYTDNNYDWTYQQARLLVPERKILPGDTLMVQCEYDSSDLDRVTHGGIETTSEMCIAFLNYYPRMNLASCQFQTSVKTLINALGIKKVGGKVLDVLELPYKPKKDQKYELPEDATILLNNGYSLDPFSNITVIQKDSVYRGKNLRNVIDDLPWKDNGGKLSKDASRKIEDGKYYAYCTRNGRIHVPLKNWLIKKPTFRAYVEKEDDYCTLN